MCYARFMRTIETTLLVVTVCSAFFASSRPGERTRNDFNPQPELEYDSHYFNLLPPIIQDIDIAEQISFTIGLAATGRLP